MSAAQPRLARVRSMQLLQARLRRSVCAVIVVVIVGLGLWALTLGSSTIAVAEIVQAVFDEEQTRTRMVVFEWRAPRVVAAIVFGAALAYGGAIFQSLTRNPLGSPDIIGFSTGSYTGVVTMLMLGFTGSFMLALGALAGGLLTAVAIYFLAYRHGMQGFRFIVVGIAIAAFLSGVNTWFSVKADVDIALRAAVWGAGTLSVVDWNSVAIGAFMFAILVGLVPFATRMLRVLELGDEVAASLGARVEPAKAWLVVFGVAATALVTAAAGPIAFVALAAPQIAKRLVGQRVGTDLLSAALVGALLLLSADLIAQYAIPSNSLPTGAVTVCLGGAYLVWLLAVESRKSRGSG
ncbi:FecCD family ABC transporter permease [Humidisolicoccus flavus]|uniref:FecCD family ABC transporter permease n=1 Tax=Humidisolicoccus flavus TaxID=3111414 RepID=UPI0032478DD7